VIYKSARGARVVAQRYREALDAWPVPRDERRVSTREGETFVVMSGAEEAQPVVLLHGSAANSAMWSHEIAELAGSFRVCAVDMIGEPGLSAPSRPPLDSEAYALWLDDVLDELGLESVALVGVSLGGWLAMDYATRRPARVTRVVVLNPSGIGRQRAGFLPKAVALSLLGARGRRRTWRMVAGDVPPSELGQSIAAHFRPRTARIPVFGDESLRALPMPVLVVLGARDALLDAADTARRAALIPHGTVRVMSDAGHVLLDQAPVITEFLLTFRVEVRHGERMLICAPDGPRIRTDRDALDVIGAAMGMESSFVVLPVERLDDDFFVLKSRLAGEIAQKFVNYRIRLAVVGDVSRWLDNESLRDFVVETNRGSQLWIVPDLDELDRRFLMNTRG
jgi:pimeloyl-ACP methyl ester carboxylesterase